MTSQPLQIGFLCHSNPLDKRSFSGSPYYMYRALQQNPDCDVRLLGNYKPPQPLRDRVLKRRSNIRALGAQDFAGLDVVLSLVSSDLVAQYGAQISVPIVHCTDATPTFLREFYGYDVPDAAFTGEEAAYDASDLVLFSSHFMRERALVEHGAQYGPKMAALSWGGNLDSVPAVLPQKPPLSRLRLLFIGKHWERKGGEIVLEVLAGLRARGVAVELHLIGTSAKGVGSIEGVIDHGFLDKNRPADWAQLQQVLGAAHVMVLPTRADCTPMVVAEANSYGVPVLITQVGGIPSLMRPGYNGDMLPLEAGAEAYVDWLAALVADPERYASLSRSSFEHFRDHLTWQAWSSAAISLLRDTFTPDARRHT